MSFAKYPSYKDSGAAWLGEVPGHWEVCALKRIVDLKSGESITAEDIEETGEYPVFGGNGLRGFTTTYTHEGSYALVGRQGALCGNVNYATGKFWASEHAVVATPRVDVEIHWLGELMRAMDLNQYSVSAAQPGLSVEIVGNLHIPVPPLAEQTAIANFLDHETAKIDALVAEQEKLIALLQEKRQAVISHAVTKGLDPNVPMKDSGVEWLGEVPGHWEVAALNYRYEVLLGKMLDEKRITGEHLAPYLRNVDVQWDCINTDELPQMDFEGNDIERYGLRKGDLLVCEGGEVGRAAIWTGALDECYYQKALHRLRPRRALGDASRFQYYLLNMAATLGIFTGGEGKATIAHLTAETLRRYRFAYPPYAEQMRISDFLDAETVRFNALLTQARTAITLLQERRTALISAAVTGQIDVRGWRNAA